MRISVVICVSELARTHGLKEVVSLAVNCLSSDKYLGVLRLDWLHHYIHTCLFFGRSLELSATLLFCARFFIAIVSKTRWDLLLNGGKVEFRPMLPLVSDQTHPDRTLSRSEPLLGQNPPPPRSASKCVFDGRRMTASETLTLYSAEAIILPHQTI